MAQKTSLPGLAALAKDASGTIITPADAGYDEARTVVMGGIDKCPAAIVRVKSPADIARAIAFSRDNKLELAVRSGGHSGAGHSATEGGIVIDVRDLTSLEIDEKGRTVWAGSGLTAGDVSAAVTAKGLAIGFGDAATVGIGGITTGGGVGYLSRKFGLTIDSLLAAEIVTADGKVLEVSEAAHPDVFWAVRGGGGNFGVVTRFKFKLNPLPAFTGGMMALPATAEIIDGFVKAARAAPEELSTIANVMAAPPMPFLPAEWHGKLIILGMFAFAGDDGAAQEALKPFRALATPLADFIKAGSYMSMFPPEDPSYKPIAVAKNLYFDRLDGVGRITVDQLNRIEGMRVLQIRVLGGAIARVATDATAYAHRAHPAMAQIAAFYDGTPADKAAKLAWVDGFFAALPVAKGAAYVNFLMDEGAERVRDAYPPATWDRLRKVKQTYDPENLFRLNQNIPPAA